MRGSWRWFVAFLLILGALAVAGCTGGSGPSVVDTAIAWINGLVTKSRSEPIASATVTLKETGERSSTDSQGRFSIGTRYRGTGTLRAEANGYLTLEWPVSITSSGTSTLQLRLVTMADYNPTLFSELTGATATVGTWRWDAPVVTYYVDRSGAYRAEFDAPLREAFTQWSMLTRRTVTFVEGGQSSAIQVRYVSSSPCGFAQAAGCAGVTNVTASGAVLGALIELHAGYATDIGVNVHEVGHTLAFTGHSPTSTDVMYNTMNGTTSPSNAEAAVASVLYGNPPGATTLTTQLPVAQLAASAPAPAAIAASGHTYTADSLLAPVRQALDDLGAAIRAWLGNPGCIINLPLVCTDSPALTVW